MSELIQQIKKSFILEKLQDLDYAFSLYNALCNVAWTNNEIINTFSWREAASIVAQLRNIDEDYLHFYPSMNEGKVSKEIREDFEKIGWVEFNFHYPELTI